jgi:hypothetical protein
MNMEKTGILYICTGKYSIFWKDFYLSMERNFISDAEKHYFVFTDSPKIDFEEENPRIHRIYQQDLGWPNNTLKRFHMFTEHEKEFLGMDYLFFLNANLLLLHNITSDEFLPKKNENLVATLHPGFFNKERSKFTYEKNPNSKAYIPKDQGKNYFAGGLNGGKTYPFLDAIKTMKEWVDIDENNNVIAVWHDESHWNKYLMGRTDVKILQPAYLYPEGWKLPFDPIILVKDKNKHGGHNLLRKEKNTLKDKLRKIFKNILNLKKLILFSGNKKITTQGVIIENTSLLITTIAYNNSEILKIQHKYLQDNLEEDFVYFIADNSNIQSESYKIEAYCQREKIPYVKLPPNPYENPSKSHGAALQWVYKNIVKSYQPEYFGFLDHDIFPYKKTKLKDKIRGRAFGAIQKRGAVWYLWPGLCFYNFKWIKNKKLKFMTKKGVDTGGANYYSLYKEMQIEDLESPNQYYLEVGPNIKRIASVGGFDNTVEIMGDWLHLMRISNWDNGNNDKIVNISNIVNFLNQKL